MRVLRFGASGQARRRKRPRGPDIKLGRILEESLEGDGVPLERRPRNGLYDGLADVQHVGPSVSGRDIDEALRAAGARKARRNMFATRRKGGSASRGVKRSCSICGKVGHMRSSCPG